MLQEIGKAAMYELLAEECTELAHAALKMARVIRDENPTIATEGVVKRQITEEVTDVDMCLKELQLYPDRAIQQYKDRRFKERWKEHEDSRTGV